MTLPDYPTGAVERWEVNLPTEWLVELGRIALFAGQVEEALHTIHWKYAKLRGPVGAIITGDTRPNRLTEDILKIMRLNNKRPRKLADMEILVSEYKQLATQRNQCIHWSWGWRASDKNVVTPPSYKGRGARIEYTLGDLRRIADDFAWLRIRLWCHLATNKNLREFRRGDPTYAIFAPAPWLDTVPGPSPMPSKTRATRKSRPRQRRSSPV